MDVLDLIDDPDRRLVPDEPFVAFHGWAQDDLMAVRELGTIELYSPGTVVIDAAARVDRSIYVVLSGELEAYRHAGDRDEQRAVFKAGHVLGELTFFDGRPRSASVRALTLSSALRIRLGDLEALGTTQPLLALRIMRELACILAGRLRSAWG